MSDRNTEALGWMAEDTEYLARKLSRLEMRQNEPGVSSLIMEAHRNLDAAAGLIRRARNLGMAATPHAHIGAVREKVTR